MDVISYRLKVKFPDLCNVRDFSSSQLKLFLAELERCSGFVVYHGADPTILDILCTRCRDRQIAALVVSTEVVQRPNACDSPYVHFYSKGIRNEQSKYDRDHRLFQDLVDKIVAIPTSAFNVFNESEIKDLWVQVDPRTDLMRRLRLLEDIIYAGPGAAGDIADRYKESAKVFYDQGVPSYAELRQEYLSWCRTADLKKN